MPVALATALPQLLALPVAGAAWLVHRRLTGTTGVLTVQVDARQGLLDADAWLRRLRRAASDPGVVAVLLEIRALPGGWATASDLRDVIAALRGSGTFVVAWVEQPGNASLWVASAADRVVVAPTAELHLTGLGTEMTFGARALELLGVEADLEAAGAYKSFGEPFTRTYMSAENREATEALLSGIQHAMVEGIAAGRGLTPEAVRDLLARAPLMPRDAVDAGLIDGIGYLDEARKAVLDDLGDGARAIPWRAWATSTAFLDALDEVGARRQVAVLHLQGSIVLDDDSAQTRIRGRRVAEQLAELADDDSIAAVVLHVDSPGGSAFASDLVWRSAVRVAEAKPLVAAYADVSASGGVYLSAAAHHVVARPTTITGSIGVFGGKLVVGKGLRKVGVGVQQVAIAPNALWMSSTTRFDDDQRTAFRALLQRTYDGFVERVAVGRGRDVADVEPHCRGRVWTGRDAVELGLVDALGTLDDAVEEAARRAELAPGTWRRHDLEGAAPRSLAALLQEVARRRTPGLHALVDRWAPLSLPGWLTAVAEQPGEALALLPFLPWDRR